MITFESSNPTGLLNEFKNGIAQGHIKTWLYDAKTNLFTHEPPQWRGKAWLSPGIGFNRLDFKFLGSKGITWADYGVYHGRFIEAMITHCHELFANGSATAKPSVADTIAA